MSSALPASCTLGPTDAAQRLDRGALLGATAGRGTPLDPPAPCEDGERPTLVVQVLPMAPRQRKHGGSTTGQELQVSTVAVCFTASPPDQPSSTRSSGSEKGRGIQPSTSHCQVSY